MHVTLVLRRTIQKLFGLGVRPPRHAARGQAALRACLVVIVAFLLGAGVAQECALEQEPNDTPAEANPFSDATCLVGELEGDDQDAWTWEVGEADAGVPWVVEIEGIENQLTKLDIVRVTFADNGVDVTSAETLWTFGTPDGRLNVSEPFLIGPGRYLLGFSKSGGSGQYVAHFRPQRALDRSYTAFDRLDEPEGAFAGFGPIEDGAAMEIPWLVGEEDAGFLWSLALRASVGDEPGVTLTGPDGEVVSGRAGGGAVRFESLGLSEGRHTVRLEGGAGVAALDVRRAGRITEGREVEPNDGWGTANVLPMDQSLTGTGGNEDYFLFDVDEEAASSAWDLVVDAGEEVSVGLYDGERELLQERRGTGGRLRDLVLEPGRYGFVIDAPEGASYELAFERSSLPEEGFEREPNDRLAGATELGEDPTVRGQLTGDEADTFRFQVTGEAQLWRIQAVGEGVEGLTLYDGSGSSLQSTSGERRLRLDNVQLLPGSTYVRVEGQDGDYALRAIALGPAPEPDPEDQPADDQPLEAALAAESPEEEAEAEPEADDADEEPAEAAAPDVPAEPTGPPPPAGRMEREPNDDASRSELLRAGEVRVGRHASASPRDYDTYRFFLAHDQLVRIEAVPPEGGRIHFDLTGAGRARPVQEGGPTVMTRWLPAGDYFVETFADEAVDGYYQLRLSLLDPMALPVDLEPNDDRETASRLPASLAWEGTVGTLGDADYYRLPTFDRDTAFRARVEGDAEPRFTFFDGEGRHDHESDEDGMVRTTIPAGTPLWWRIQGTGRYRVEAELERAPDPEEVRPDPAAGAAELAFERAQQDVTAYWHEGQVVRSTVTVENAGDSSTRFELDARTSHAAIEASLERSELTLEPGEATEVPLTVRVPPDARDDQPVRVNVAARSETSVDTASTVLQPRCDAPPVGSTPMWRVPDPMLGGMNMAWRGLGARATGESADDVAALFDGRTAPSTGAYRAPGEHVTVELPGDEPVELAGALLHPQSRGNTGEQLRRFRIEVSRDGTNFETVAEGALEAARMEQAFTFDQPVRARYARLTFLDNHEGSGRRIYLGEWKLVAPPEAEQGRRNVADPALGGYVAWSDPLHRGGSGVLTPDLGDGGRLDLRGLGEATWVVGFHHDRAVRVERLEWVGAPDVPDEQRFREVRVERSLAGPAGPWRELADWTLERRDGVATLDLAEPTWTRFLRFTAPKTEEERYGQLPGTLRVLRAPLASGDRSALGEWGHYRQDAAYEWSTRDEAAVRRLGEDDNDELATATALSTGERIEGSVLVGEDEDWYEFTVAEGENLLELQLRGDPSIGYEYELFDANGEPVFFEIDEDGYDLTLRAYPEPGRYYLRLHEPKRSVIFSWDTSGSVSPYQAITYNSLAGFATDVDATREFVQLLAFNDPRPIWLLPYWSSDPERVQRSINQFDRNADSSNAEKALLAATRALGSREGTRAVLFMTDAESPGYDLTPELWRALSDVQPRVFTFEISTAGSDYSQDLMQSWASVNQGYYDYARNVADFDIGFARASCHLRRPKRYELEAAARSVEPPGPGSLQVTRAEEADRPAVEVIFDASGSMGSPLPNGRPRIEVAKEVLNTLVSDILPEGTPFAFRAFGHIEPQSCETRLDVPLTPLDPEVAREAFDAIQPKLLSQTPIAESLRQVASDLSGTDAAKTVVLITDGEESCGGDPESALAELRDAGVEVQLSIVSLGLDEAAARERFKDLAELGGGTYVDAEDRESLQASVEAALYPPFEVLGADGEVVARGQVAGPAVEVPMGVYTVRVPGDPPQLFRDVRVPGDSDVSVTVGAE